MKLRRLQIENFRGLKSFELELGDTTVLIGENNTGKTAVLDALNFTMPESDIEQHLCAAGFGMVYESLLTPQTKANVTVAPGDPAYWL